MTRGPVFEGNSHGNYVAWSQWIFRDVSIGDFTESRSQSVYSKTFVDSPRCSVLLFI